MATHYLYRQGDWSLKALGRVIGRHHSTVIHGRDRVDDLLSVDPGFAALYKEFERRLEKLGTPARQRC